MRWYLLSSPILRGTDMIVTEDGSRDAVRQVMLPIWNSWYFLSLYSNAANTQGTFRDRQHRRARSLHPCQDARLARVADGDDG